jgi:hypothetical protein
MRTLIAFILLVLLAPAACAQAPVPLAMTNQPPLIFFRATACSSNQESGFSEEATGSGPSFIEIGPPLIGTLDHYNLYFGRSSGNETNVVNVGTNTLIHWPLFQKPRITTLTFSGSLITSTDMVHWTTNEQMYFRNAKILQQ